MTTKGQIPKGEILIHSQVKKSNAVLKSKSYVQSDFNDLFDCIDMFYIHNTCYWSFVKSGVLILNLICQGSRQHRLKTNT